MSYQKETKIIEPNGHLNAWENVGIKVKPSDQESKAEYFVYTGHIAPLGGKPSYLRLNPDQSLPKESLDILVSAYNVKLRDISKLYESTQRHVEILQCQVEMLKSERTIANFSDPDSGQYKNYPPTFSSYEDYQSYKNLYHRRQGDLRAGFIAHQSGKLLSEVLIEMADRLYKSTSYFLHDVP